MILILLLHACSAEQCQCLCCSILVNPGSKIHGAKCFFLGSMHCTDAFYTQAFPSGTVFLVGKHLACDHMIGFIYVSYIASLCGYRASLVNKRSSGLSDEGEKE